MNPIAPRPEPETAVDRPTLTRRHGTGQWLLDSLYLFTAFPLALVAFAVVVAGAALGLAFAWLVWGVLLLTVSAAAARGFARVERTRLRKMLGSEVAAPSYLRPSPGDGFWRQALLPLKDRQSWLDMSWCLAGLVTGTAGFLIAVAWWGVAVGGLTYWAWGPWIPYDPDTNHTLAEFLGFGKGQTPTVVFNAVSGAVAALSLPLAMRFAACLHGGLAQLLLGRRAEALNSREAADERAGHES